MSAAKKALRTALQAWRSGLGPAPQILRACGACGEERWRPIDRRHGHFELDAHLPNGARADLTLSDRAGRLRLILRLTDGSRLPNRTQPHADVGVIEVSGAALAADPLRWRPLREHGLPAWRCRCALARPLPVDDAFSLRVMGCPLNLRRDEGAVSANGGATPGSHASVIQDCARCSFFVGIGYADAERRRVSLYCGFGAAARPRRAIVSRLSLPTIAA
jgi:hypothetical protein